MPSARLTIIVRLDQAASLGRLQEFVEERRTPIGTDVSVLLSADDGPAATKLFSDLGALAIPFEATATIGENHYLVAGDGNQISVVEAWASTPAGLADPPRRTDGSWTQTACGNTNGIVNSWTGSPNRRRLDRHRPNRTVSQVRSVGGHRGQLRRGEAALAGPASEPSRRKSSELAPRAARVGMATTSSKAVSGQPGHLRTMLPSALA
jgi:hypothetical protein